MPEPITVFRTTIESPLSKLSELIPFLNQKMKTGDMKKMNFITQLRDNLVLLRYTYDNKMDKAYVIEKISNEGIHKTVEENFNFKNLRRGLIIEAFR